MGGRQRGELTPQVERVRLVSLIQAAQTSGSRLDRACEEVMLSKRTYRRRYQSGKV